MTLTMYLRARDDYSSAFTKLAMMAETTRGKLELLSGTAALMGIALIGASVDAAAHFEAMTQKVINNTTLGKAGLDAMRAAILQLAATSPASLDDLAGGFMHIANYGYSAKDAVTILDAAMKSAVATGASVESVAEALANIMHEFGIKTKEAGQAMDVLHLAAAQGNMTLQQFTESTGKALGMAANLHVPLTEVAAALSALTRHGESASIASTNLAGMLEHIVNPSQAARKELEALSRATGINLVADFSAAGLQSKGFSSVLADLQKATGGNVEEIFKLIPAMRGGQAAMLLAGTAAADYRTILDSLGTVMAGKATPTAAAFAASQETLGFQMGRLKNAVQELAIALGTPFLGSLAGATHAVADMVLKVVDLVNAHPKLTAAVLAGITAFAALVTGLLAVHVAMSAVTTALGTLGGAFGLLKIAVGVLPAVLAALSGAFGLLTGALGVASVAVEAFFVAIGPIGWAILGLIAVVALLAAAWKNDWLGIREVTATVLGAIGSLMSAAWNAIKATVESVMSAVTTKITGDWTTIKAIMTTVVDALIPLVTTAWNAIRSATDSVNSALKSGITMTWTAIKTAVEGTMTALKSAVEGAWNAIKTAVSTALSALKTTIINDWNAIKSAVEGTMTGLKSAIEGAWNAIKTAVSGALNTLKTIIINDWNAIKSAVTSAVDGLKAAITNAWNAIKGAVESTMTALKGAIEGAWNAIKSAVEGVMNGLKSSIEGAWNAIKGAASGAAHGIATDFTGGLQAILGLVGGVLGQLKNTVLGALGALAHEAFSAGANIAQMIANGITSAISGVVKSISDLAGAIAAHLPHSPAQTGPLAQALDFRYIADALRAAAPQVRAASAELAGAVAVSLPGVSAPGAGSSGSSAGARASTSGGRGGAGTGASSAPMMVTIAPTIHIDGGMFTDRQSISDLAQRVSDEIMHSVRLQGGLLPQV